MRKIVSFLLCFPLFAWADTIDHYMNIVSNIPQMEMKADPEAQAWARSARNVLILTCESIAETLTLMNETAKQHGGPLFCLPQGVTLNAMTLNDIIQQTYHDIPNQPQDKNRLTVSQIALTGLGKRYPCASTQNTVRQIVNTAFGGR